MFWAQRQICQRHRGALHGAALQTHAAGVESCMQGVESSSELTSSPHQLCLLASLEVWPGQACCRLMPFQGERQSGCVLRCSCPHPP